MTTSEFKPSWARWPPNSCEVCTAWKKEGDWVGVCQRAASVNFGQPTDARQRCPEYQRKPDA